MKKNHKQGFTLLEVLIAIMVFVLAVSSILPLFAVGTAAHRRGIDQTEASLLAARISAEIQQDLYDLNPKDIVDANFQDRGKTYLYDAQFLPFDRNDPFRSAFIVKVQVKWKVGGQDHKESFDTVLLRKILR